jgi:acyl carrier protein
MELNEFVQKFGGEFDDTPIETFKANTVFKNIPEWGSLTALSIIAMIDETYEKQITGEDIRNSNTIEDLFNVVKNK